MWVTFSVRDFEVVTQVVVPKEFCSQQLNLAHDCSMSEEMTKEPKTVEMTKEPKSVESSKNQRLQKLKKWRLEKHVEESKNTEMSKNPSLQKLPKNQRLQQANIPSCLTFYN